MPDSKFPWGWQCLLGWRVEDLHGGVGWVSPDDENPPVGKQCGGMTAPSHPHFPWELAGGVGNRVEDLRRPGNIIRITTTYDEDSIIL